MTYDEYVQALADVMSGDSDRVRAGNEALFGAAVGGDKKDKNPLLALADAADLG